MANRKTKPKAVDRYVINGRTYTVDPQTKLGAGSEGIVLPHPSLTDVCIKLFHPPDVDDKEANNIARYRARKIRAICSMGLRLPPQFTLPEQPVLDETGQHVIGFQMRRIPPGYHKFISLLDSSFRTNYQVDLALVARLYADIFDDLAFIHGKDFVVGDVNLGCLLFEVNGRRAWVDCDSWSFGDDFPCLGKTEMFAHPDLFPNFNGSKDFIVPLPQHDRFAFLVAFSMMAIPGAHPFRMGTHPTVQGLQNRASAGVTIFDPDVKVPPMIGSFDVLSDDLLTALVDRLKRRTEAPLDSDVLRAFADEVITCPNCDGSYHRSRRVCPACNQVTARTMPGLVDYLIDELFRVPGTLLYAQVVDTDIYLVCRVGNTVRIIRVDGHGQTQALSPHLPNTLGARYRFFGNCLVVCPDPKQPAPVALKLYRVDGANLTALDATATGALEGEGAVFDTTARNLYRLAGNALVRSELFGPRGMVTDTQVAEVYRSQTWFTADHITNADREVVFGYNRGLRDWEWFVVHGNMSGSQAHYYTVGDLGLKLNETVEDFAVHFSKSSVLLVMQTALAGRDYIRYAVIGLDGVVHVNEIVEADDDTYPYWENLRGKLHQGGSVLHLTADGIVKQQFSDGHCTTLRGTDDLVTPEDRFVRLNGGAGIVRRSGVYTLSKKK